MPTLPGTSTFNPEAYWEGRHKSYGGDDLRSTGNKLFSSAANMQQITEKIALLVWLIRSVGLPRNARLLDAGCGQGFTTRYLASAGFDCFGVDVSPTAIETARRAGAGHYALAALHDMQLGRRFDVVLCADVLYHVVDDDLWERSIGDLADHLDDGGVLVVVESFTDSPSAAAALPMAADAPLQRGVRKARPRHRGIRRLQGVRFRRPEDGSDRLPKGKGRPVCRGHRGGPDRGAARGLCGARGAAGSAGGRAGRGEGRGGGRAARQPGQARCAGGRAGRGEAAAAEERRASLAELEAAGAKIAALQARARKAAALEGRLKALERSVSFRLGHAIVRAARFPAALLKGRRAGRSGPSRGSGSTMGRPISSARSPRGSRRWRRRTRSPGRRSCSMRTST